MLPENESFAFIMRFIITLYIKRAVIEHQRNSNYSYHVLKRHLNLGQIKTVLNWHSNENLYSKN